MTPFSVLLKVIYRYCSNTSCVTLYILDQDAYRKKVIVSITVIISVSARFNIEL